MYGSGKSTILFWWNINSKAEKWYNGTDTWLMNLALFSVSLSGHFGVGLVLM